MNVSLAHALEREHREIDAGIEAFIAAIAAGTSPPTEQLNRAVAALRRHIYLEEVYLFPPLREAGMVAPVFVMVREHAALWQTLGMLGAELRNPAAIPASAAGTCRDLIVQLGHHNRKEERILYPQADSVLTDAASAQLRTLLDTGEIPEGWVCEGLR